MENRERGESSGTEGTEGSSALADRLAEAMHDAWCHHRLAEGWRYGPRLDEEDRAHPGIVPFAELPESKRRTYGAIAGETLRTLGTSGYRLERPSVEEPGPGSDGPAESRYEAILRDLESPELDLGILLSIWRTPPDQRVRWGRNLEIYRRIGWQALRLGEPLFAYDVFCEGLERAPGDLRMQQLKGLALARSGATRLAANLLSELDEEGQVDEETSGLLARVERDWGVKASTAAERDDYYRRALKRYARAFKRYGSIWTGINAATLSLLLREKPAAQKLARQVREKCEAALNDPAADRYWALATLGEAALVLGEYAVAEAWYAQAAALGQRNFGDLNATRRNARLLAEHLGLDWERINACFNVPKVVVFVGHMIDRPDRAFPRFPPRLEPAVAQAIRDRLVRMGTRIGYSSAACGSDILFLEAIESIREKTEIHVVLPFSREPFLETSVDLIPGGNWRERFERLTGPAGRAEVITASSQRLEAGGTSYEFANRILHGLAAIKARQLETELKFLVVWDGKPGGGPGGTDSTVAHWKALGHEVEVIDLAALLRAECPELAAGDGPSSAAAPVAAPEPHSGIIQGSQVMALLFADVVGFSKLSESQIPKFVQEFLGLVDALTPPPPHGPLKKNTWGDGLYFAFESVRDAGVFALDLCDHVAATTWARKGLPDDLDLRIGLHAGPVYNCIDPVTKQPNSIGTHVSRAARIEPITPPGHVYASREFVALAAAEGVNEFACHYVGQTPYAKAFGTYPTYHVHRSRE